MSSAGDDGDITKRQHGLGTEESITSGSETHDSIAGIKNDVKSFRFNVRNMDKSNFEKEPQDIEARTRSKRKCHTDVYKHIKSRLQQARTALIQHLEPPFKQYVLQGLFRQRQLGATKDSRKIELNFLRKTALMDERTGHPYINNAIRSSRYTLWTFIPFQLWFQFSKASNIYFLIMSILQLIPGLSTTGSFTNVVPFLAFLGVTILREAYDDFKRYQMDKAENRRLARALRDCMLGGNDQEKQTGYLRAIQRTKNSVGFNRGREESALVQSDLEGKDVSALTVSSGFLLQATEPWSDSGQRSNTWYTVEWIHLKVGDVIELHRDEQVPADIVLIHADGRNGCAYVETVALDGETNLKAREPPKLLSGRCDSLKSLSNCRAHFLVEDPNLDLYEFQGKVTIDGTTLPLTLNNVIYRGCTIRNTNRVIGMIVNTGEECKIRMNASKHPQAKAPVMQKISNKVVIIMAAFVVLVTTGCSAGYLVWTRVFENHAWYLANAHIRFADIFIAFAIMFNNLVPLALYISLEIVKFGQFILMHDVEMYDSESGIPMVSNTQTIYENLGQINYLLSDKTGTLTENVMSFRKFTVAGTAWRHELVTTPPKQSSMHRTNSKVLDPTTIELKVSAAIDSKSLKPPGMVINMAMSDSALSCADPSQEPTSTQLIRYIQRHPEKEFSKRAQMFLLSLALCHTCFPEPIPDGDINYQSASPDEQALVEAARDLGYIVADRMSNSITLKTLSRIDGKPLLAIYQVLDVIEFSSQRKRMSIVVRFPDGKIYLFCKGADSVVESRLRHSSLALSVSDRVKHEHEVRASEEADRMIARRSQEVLGGRRSFNKFGLNLAVPSMGRRSSSLDRASYELNAMHDRTRRSRDLRRDPSFQIDTLVKDAENLSEAKIFERCFQHIDGFATEGLRTLVYAYRFLKEDEYAAWATGYHEATTSLSNRQEMVEEAGERIEKNLELAGATAIEDKLQQGVPETIDKLQRANIRIWMLTGDKRETAINIAHSAHLCKTYSQVITLQYNQTSWKEQIDSALIEVATGRHTVVVIDGQTLSAIENEEGLALEFFRLLFTADSVICCRASPSQKAALVKAIREKVPNSITLAIGDGGNDISMIQEAHVGVGISGKEGLQAARVADFSIAKFRFLQRLLLVHGHWNYLRMAKSILWTFWKEMLFYCIQIMYTRWCGYTGTSLYESDSLTVWNTLFTSLCVILPGIFEQDLSAATLLAVPELYFYGQQSRGFNLRNYTWWMLQAAVQCLIIWFLLYGLYGMTIAQEDQTWFAIGDMAYSICVVFINFKLLYVHLPLCSFFFTTNDPLSEFSICTTRHGFLSAAPS